MILKSGINLFELFIKQEEINIVFQKIYSIIFTIKSETNNAKYLSSAFIEAMKAIKLDNEILQNKFDKLIINLDKILLFIRFPKYQNGIANFLKIPGLSPAITLNNKEKNLLLKSF